MASYRITNITNTFGKRDFKANSELEISYVNNMVKKTMKLRPNDSIYFTAASLPLSVHRLRVKGLVTVVEVSEKEIPKPKKKATPKKKVSPKKTVGDKPKETATTIGKKTTKKAAPKKKATVESSKTEDSN